MDRNCKRIAFLAYALYFLTGAACIVVGSSLPQLVEMYEIELSKVVLLGSAYAIGRVSTVYFTGRLVEKIGPLKVFSIGTLLIAVFLFGVPTFANYYAGLVFAFLGGVGMGSQDTVCPLFLSISFRDNYAASLSAGQAFFGLGNFATPFLVGLFLAWRLPFYYSYYVLIVVPVLMLSCVPFVKMNWGETCGKGEEEHVKPLYAKNKLLVMSAIVIVTAAYSAVTNTIMLYTSSFAKNLGISSSTAAFMLTAYNVGCFAGSAIFVIILRKIPPQSVLLWNNVFTLVSLVLMLSINKPTFYFIGLSVSGFFLGVLFSVIVTIATRTNYEHISRASSLVATAGGGSDSLTPMITGALVGIFGVEISYKYAILMVVVSIAAALVLLKNTTERKVS